MKWMIVLGSAAAVIGGLYRWFVAPAESEKWGMLDVIFVVIGMGGAGFFVLGLFLLGLKEVLRYFR